MPMDPIPDGAYRSTIESLLLAATRARPDIALSLGILSQYVTKPTGFLLRAEYIAMTEACKDLVWLRVIMNEFGFHQSSATFLYGDNISTKHGLTVKF